MKKILAIIFLVSAFNLSAQTTPDAKVIDLKEGTVKEKFDNLYRKSNNYKNYKVIKQYLLVQLKKQVLDSLDKEKKAYQKATGQIKDLQQQIASLETELQQTKDQIASLEAEKDHIGFVGVPVQKSKYQTIMWSLVALLLAALMYFIFMFRNSNMLTRTAKDNLFKIEEEYNTFRTNALEREQLLKRKLLDEQKKNNPG